MTVSVNDAISTFITNGVTTAFTYDFPCDNSDELKVYLDNIEQVSGYTVNLTSKTVTFTSAPASGQDGVIARFTQVTQQVDYSRTSNSVNLSALGAQLDEIVYRIQELDRDITRAIKVNFGVAETALPDPESDKLLAWNTAATALVNKAVAQLDLVEIINTVDMAPNSATAVPSQYSVNVGKLQKVATRTALKELTTRIHSVVYLFESGREGMFVFYSSDLSTEVAADPEEGVYVAPDSDATGVSGAWVRQFTKLSVEYFGASASATRAANTTAIQAAINFAQLYTGYLYFPALYPTSGPITVSKNIVLEGVSAFTSGISTNSGAAISLVPSTLISNNNTWYGFRYLSIISTDAGAHYGVEYSSTGDEYLSNWEMVGCYLSGTAGGASFDSSGSTVGIFSCTIRRNWFNNGMVIRDGGDSITITENTINGNGIGILVNALKTGARQLVIRNNNITTLSECVYLLNVPGGAIVESNWMETPYYLGSYTGTTNALCYVQASPNTRIIRNTIQPLASVGGGFVPAGYAIRLNVSGSASSITDNSIAIGGTGHIQIGAGVSNTLIANDNNFDVTAVITDAGTSTFGAGNSPGVFNQRVTFRTSAQYTSVISAECTDAGAGNGPYYDIFRDSASPAASDGLGGMLWYGRNSGATKTNYAYITGTITDPTAGTEDGQLNFARMLAGALVIGMTIGTTIQMTVALGVTGNITSSGNILSTGTGIGYATGAGGAVTQATSRSTGVTLNKPSGAITLFTAAGSATPTTFTVTNSSVAATDTISLSIKSGASNTYFYFVTAVTAGSFSITFWTTGGTTSDTPVINFNVIKGVAS